MHQQFIEPTKEYADIIIPNNRRNTVAIDIVKAIVHNRINNLHKINNDGLLI